MLGGTRELDNDEEEKTLTLHVCRNHNRESILILRYLFSNCKTFLFQKNCAVFGNFNIYTNDSFLLRLPRTTYVSAL